MIIFAPQEFITWTNTLVQFPWPIQLNDFPPYAEKLGWKPTPRPTWFNVLPDNDDEITMISSDREGNVHNLFLYMEAYSQTACRPAKPLVRAHLRKAVNKAHGIE